VLVKEKPQTQEVDIEIVSIRRGENRHLKPHGNTKIQMGDILVLYGSPDHLENAEKSLLEG